MKVDVAIVTKIKSSCKIFHAVDIVSIFENDILVHVKILVIILSEGN